MAGHSGAFLTLVNEAKARIKQVHAREMPAILEKDPRAKLIDTREESEYADGHVENAEWIGAPQERARQALARVVDLLAAVQQVQDESQAEDAKTNHKEDKP